MENFFNYLSKPLPSDEVDIWFRVNNIIPEKMELYSDFSISLYSLILETYLGDTTERTETKIKLTQEDNLKHFEWCFGRIIDNFKKEGISFKKKGEHFDYFKNFFMDVYYNQKEENVKNNVKLFLTQLFNPKTLFSKSDLDMISIIYKNLDKNMKI
jgi:hypothetical protein